MGIDTDCRFAKGNGNDKICCFSPHARQLHKFVNGVRNPAGKFFGKHAGQCGQVFGLVSEKTDRVDDFLQLGNRDPFQLVRGCRPLEQPAAGGSRYLVLGAGGENGGYQHLERIFCLGGNQVNHRHLVLGDLFLQQGDNLLYIKVIYIKAVFRCCSYIRHLADHYSDSASFSRTLGKRLISVWGRKREAM